MYVYVLKLENNKYFIGNTYNPFFSLSTYNHIENDKNEFTFYNKPISVYEFIPKCDDYDTDKFVKKYMDDYGIDNVRGGVYNTLNLDINKKNFIQKELWYINNLCTNCGKSHLTDDCIKFTKLDKSQDKNNTNNKEDKKIKKNEKCRYCMKFF